LGCIVEVFTRVTKSFLRVYSVGADVYSIVNSLAGVPESIRIYLVLTRSENGEHPRQVNMCLRLQGLRLTGTLREKRRNYCDTRQILQPTRTCPEGETQNLSNVSNFATVETA